MSKLVKASRLPAKSVNGLKETIWIEINRILGKYPTVNLGQGFPDFSPPSHVLKHSADASNDPKMHQYARGSGHPRLVESLAKLYNPMFQCKDTIPCNLMQETFTADMKLDPASNVIITVGAYGALYNAFKLLVDPGDECIIIEPSFDCYSSMVEGNGGVPIFTQLRPKKNPTSDKVTSNDWVLDLEELETKVSKKTKVLVLNTPNNPLGKVFSKAELEQIAAFAIKHNLAVISDEVYEWIAFDVPHLKIASLPGMWSRTLTIGSGGKTFSVTGWKVGWTIGPSEWIHYLNLLQQNIVNSVAKPLQEALARSFEDEHKLYYDWDQHDKCYLKYLGKELEKKAADFANLLDDIGLKPVRANSGYFLISDMTPFADRVKQDDKINKDQPFDFQVNEWMIRNYGINGIPNSVFYNQATEENSKHIRWCFAKSDETLAKAREILIRMKNH